MATRNELLFPSENRPFLTPFLPSPPSSPLHKQEKPWVTLTFATSLDSSLSLSPTIPTALSGPASKSMTHYLRSHHDAILIGVGTAISDNPSLNCRLSGVGGYGGEGLQGQPRPVVVDPRGRWGVGRGSKCVELAREGRGRGPWVVTCSSPSTETVRVLEKVGGEVITLPAGPGSSSDTHAPPRIKWKEILETLAEKGVKSVMIEGGAGVINALLAPENAELVDSVIVTIAPTWLGKGGVVVCPERSAVAVPVARLRGTVWRQLGEDCVLCGTLR